MFRNQASACTARVPVRRPRESSACTLNPHPITKATLLEHFALIILYRIGDRRKRHHPHDVRLYCLHFENI